MIGWQLTSRGGCGGGDGVGGDVIGYSLMELDILSRLGLGMSYSSMERVRLRSSIR